MYFKDQKSEVTSLIVLQCATHACHVPGAVGKPITARCVFRAEVTRLRSTVIAAALGHRWPKEPFSFQVKAFSDF